MTKFLELAQTNVETANAIHQADGVFDDTAAELLLRNAAVITDRLDASTFWRLPPRVSERVFAAASLAKEIAPLSAEDATPIVDEPADEHLYRVTVWQPLHSIQSKLASRDYDKTNPEEVARLRTVVHLGSAAFAAVLMASEDNPVIVDTERYFWGNTDAAAGRIARISQTS